MISACGLMYIDFRGAVIIQDRSRRTKLSTFIMLIIIILTIKHEKSIKKNIMYMVLTCSA